jgi:hypothetical protein
VTPTPDELRERAETDMHTSQPAPALCNAPHHRYPETLCTEPPGHYQPNRDPHAGPLIINGRECGGAAWDEPGSRP